MTIFLGFISREMKDNAELSKGIVFFLRYTRCKIYLNRIICRRILTGFSPYTRNSYGRGVDRNARMH